jgi:uncharacterized protein (TIGR02001 family)
MKLSRLSLALAAALFAFPMLASAQDEASAEEEVMNEEAEAATEEGEDEDMLTWNLAVTSDYMFRGVSQTDEGPALQGGLDIAWDSGWYIGAWASNVDFDDTDGPDIEVDTYIGYNTDLNDEWNLDLMLTRYNYFGERNGYGDGDYFEVIGALTYAETYTFTLGYTPDIYNLSEDSLYFGIGGAWELQNEFTLSGGIGYTTFDSIGLEDYMDYNLGIGRAFGPVNATLAWHGTDSNGDDNFGDWADDRVVLTLSIEN